MENNRVIEIDLAAAWSGWEEVYLPKFFSELTEQAQDILRSREDARSRRKTLASETKRFRNEITTVPDALLLKLSTLVQSYQREIEQLTHRAKNAENKFLKLFKTVREQVDPCSLLRHLRNENDKNVRNVEDLKEKYRGKLAEVKRLEQQLQTTETNIIAKVKGLKKKWKIESKQQFDSLLRQQTDILQAELADQSSAGAAEFAQLQKEIDLLNEENQRLRFEMRESNVVNSRNGQDNNNSSTKSSPRSDSMHARLLHLEDENGRLQLELKLNIMKQKTVGSQAAEAVKKANERAEKAEISSSAAFAELEATRKEHSALQDRHETTSNLRRKVSVLKNKIAVLAPLVGDADLSSIDNLAENCVQTNADEICNEVDVNDGDNRELIASSSSSSSSSSSMVHMWFVRNNRQLRAKVTDMDNKLEDLNNTLQNERKRITEIVLDNSLKKATIKNLESILQKTADERTPTCHNKRSKCENASSVVDNEDLKDISQQNSDAVISTSTVDQNKSLLDLVSTQRDHFRRELQRCETALNDKVKLFESLRKEMDQNKTRKMHSNITAKDKGYVAINIEDLNSSPPQPSKADRMFKNCDKDTINHRSYTRRDRNSFRKLPMLDKAMHALMFSASFWAMHNHDLL